ncbi:MAG TPA: hypothetical protein VK308_11670 [Pyrinomonadaceae bacterium]|nr:hypothetical protein [Pyrinomonadaceae bacterium]
MENKNSRKKSIVGFIISIISVLGINFIPLEMLLYKNYSSETTMIVYALENVLTIFLATVFIMLFAPRLDLTGKIRTRKELLQMYLISTVSLSVGTGIFLSFFIFVILRVDVSFQAVVTAMIWIFGFLILEFIADSIMLRPLSLAQADIFLTRSVRRVFLLFLCVFLGIFLAAFVSSGFVAPFIILKTLADIADQIEIYKGFRGETVGGKLNQA